ncbi:MAG: nitroreductase [Parvibaculum sp.]|nr:nitroreductase [Parvibaculum sp.]
MNVSDALKSRMTCRAFLPKPVPEATVRQILEAAKHAPSGGNLQPWHVYVLTGDRLKDFLAIIAAKQAENPFGEGTEYDVYPKAITEPYKARRSKCGEDLYASIGVAREDKEGRMNQFMRNFRFFDAPVAMFFAIDRQMGQCQWSGLGMFIQSAMLAAREHGLHSCAQEAWAVWHKTVAEFVGMPDDLMLFCGMGLGYMDESAPINQLRTERAPLEEFASISGF